VIGQEQATVLLGRFVVGKEEKGPWPQQRAGSAGRGPGLYLVLPDDEIRRRYAAHYEALKDLLADLDEGGRFR
jgi:hypothetical protein